MYLAGGVPPADGSSMRGRAASVSLAVVLLMAGCTTYGGLRSVVDQAAPPDAARVGECQEYGVFASSMMRPTAARGLHRAREVA